MNTTNNAAPSPALRRIVWRCLGRSLFLVLAVAALALLLSLELLKLLPGQSLSFPLVFVLATTTFAALCANFEQRFWTGTNDDKPPPALLLGEDLRQAMQADLVAIGRTAGLPNPIQLCVRRESPVRLAYVISWIGKHSPVRVFVPETLAKSGLSRPEIQAVFAHEIGHALLASSFWYSFVMVLLYGFVAGSLALPALAFTCLGADALAQYCGGIAALMVSIAGLIVFCAAVMVALAATGAWLSRIHERAADQISAHLTGAGQMAAVLTKWSRVRARERTRLRGAQEKAVSLPARLLVLAPVWVRLLHARLMATHPSDSRRIAASRQAS